MSKLSSRKTFFACLTLAALSTIAFAISRTSLLTSSRRPVRVTYQVTKIEADGTRRAIATHVRTLADGQMRRQEYHDGKLYLDQYISTDGTIYGVSHKRRELNAANLPHKFNLNAPPQTAETFKAQKQFHRTEQILGITAYVFRINDDDGMLIKELWFAPETDPLPLKEILYRDDGSQHVVEATSVKYDNVGEVRPMGYMVK
ncbi:hypothetical protein BH18ACI2_BH18ACI2_23910 [soil metagenome]